MNSEKILKKFERFRECKCCGQMSFFRKTGKEPYNYLQCSSCGNYEPQHQVKMPRVLHQLHKEIIKSNPLLSATDLEYLINSDPKLPKVKASAIRYYRVKLNSNRENEQ